MKKEIRKSADSCTSSYPFAVTMQDGSEIPYFFLVDEDDKTITIAPHSQKD